MRVVIGWTATSPSSGLTSREVSGDTPNPTPELHRQPAPKPRGDSVEIRIEGLVIGLADGALWRCDQLVRYLAIAWSTQALEFWKDRWP